MDTKKKLEIVKYVGEFAIGWTIGAVTQCIIQPQGAFQKAMTLVGGAAIAITVGNAFDREFNDYCDTVWDVDMNG